MKLTSHQQIKVKKKIVEEFRSYITYFIFLAVIFFVFNFYEELILSSYHIVSSSISSFHYGYSMIEALILAKVILIGQAMHLGNRYENKPLIIPVIYKTILFCLLFFMLEIIEHLLIGMIYKENIMGLVGQHVTAIAIKVFILSWVFILTFSFLELSNVLGKGILFKLFFKPRLNRREIFYR